jgi:hypothetical protein
LENTFEEWRIWVETADEPKSCQDCHMPEGNHEFLGIHDRDYVLENVEIATEHQRIENRMKARITIANTGGGHHLPTYVTPKIYVHGYFRDSLGRPIKGSQQQVIVGRGAQARTRDDGKTEWYDEYDRRIPAGESFAFNYDGEIPEQAATFHLEIVVAPDDYYNWAYSIWKDQQSRSEVGRQLLSQAYEETLANVSGYYLLQEEHVVE